MENGDPGDSPGLDRGTGLHVDIMARSPRWADAGVKEEALRAALAACYASLGRSGPCEIALVLSDDRDIRALNRAWRDADKPTNVLAFPAQAGDPPDGAGDALLGDVVLAYETVAREAREAGLSVSQHASHLAIHGLLHLSGYDHDSEESAAEMEGLESLILSRLGLHDPHAEAAG